MIKPVQQCRTLDGWIPVRVPSASDENQIYVVHVNPWGTANESVCECLGYTFNGRCRHQREALEGLCRWTELEGPEVQTPAERRAKRCPRCSGSTAYTLEEVEDG